MNFIKVSDNAYLLNQTKLTRRSHENTLHQSIQGKTTSLNFEFKKEYFNLSAPYINTANGKHNRRKRKLPMTEEEIEEQKYHESISPKFLQILSKIRITMKETSDKNDRNDVIVDFDNSCGKCSEIFRQLCHRRSHKDNNTIEICREFPIHFDLHHITNRLVSYNGNRPRTVCINGEQYLLPKKCRFLKSNASCLDPLLKLASENGGFDVIVLDPPWENISAKRGQKYAWLSLGDIGKLPLRNLARDGCIVLVWVTNKQKVRKFVKDELFPINEIEYVTEWQWLKITNSGDPVVSFTSLHKRPYETIIVGTYHKVSDDPIPHNILISVPCSIHSHKPPLDDFIASFTSTKDPQCLEMFARNLKPQWTSWGNEVIELQNIKYFDNVETSITEC